MSNHCTVPVLLGRCNFNVGEKKKKRGEPILAHSELFKKKEKEKKRKGKKKKVETKSE